MVKTKEVLAIRDSVAILPLKEDELNIITSKSMFNIVGEEVKEIVYPLIEMVEDKYNISKIMEVFSEKGICSEKILEIIIKLEKYGVVYWKENVDKTYFLKNAFLSEKIDAEKVIGILKKFKVGIVSNTDNEEIIKAYFNKMGIINIVTMDITNNLGVLLKDSKVDFLFFFQNSDDIVNKYLINTACIENRIPFLYVYASGFEMKVGPLVVPHKTSCLECYEKRLESNLIYAEDRQKWYNYALHNGKHIGNDEKLFLVENMAISWGIIECIKFIIKEYTWIFPEVIEAEIYFNMFNGMHKRNKIMKNPRCKCCMPEKREKPTVRAWMETHKYQG